MKIIVEGNEEEAFFDAVKQVGVDKSFYIDIENAQGYGNIGNVLLDSLRAEVYDCVICIYDVDGKAFEPNSAFNITRSHLLSIFGDEEIVNTISFCSNPNILIYFLLAADDLTKINLTSSSKKANSSIVHKYWPSIASNKTNSQGNKIKCDYSAASWQLDLMKYSIINGEYKYDTLLANSASLSMNYTKDIPSGNLLPLLIALKEGDTKYFKKIAKATDAKD